MLAYIPAPWILWVCIRELGGISQFSLGKPRRLYQWWLGLWKCAWRRLAPLDGLASPFGGFHKWGIPNSWLVFLVENPNLKWMICDYTPISGNLHMFCFIISEFGHIPPDLHSCRSQICRESAPVEAVKCMGLLCIYCVFHLDFKPHVNGVMIVWGKPLH
jgi:hypothetical protein